MSQAERNAELIRLWNEGVPGTEIGQVLGMGMTTVYFWRDRLGLEKRHDPKAPESSELATIKREWMAGKSAGEIAAMLEGRTRNSVIGIVHRNGWSDRPTPPRLTAKPKPPRIQRPKVVKHPKTKVGRAQAAQAAIHSFTLPEIDSPHARPFMESGRSHCKWPIGDGPTMLACCNPVRRGSWCEGHASVGFASKQPTKLTWFDRKPQPVMERLGLAA